jgi:NAD(P)-dependent dehydrogenase (short-subunit alcohol dehydrogenase family)
VTDVDAGPLDELARAVGGQAIAADLTTEAAVTGLIERAQQRFGPVDLFVSNAGFLAGGGLDAPDEVYEAAWALHVMAHVWAARRLVPDMTARGEGYLVITASAAGLLSNVRGLPYTLTKHAAVALAEWLSITYGDAGIRSSCICPLGVRTALLESDPVAAGELASGRKLDPAEVAESVVAGLRAERCLILPHPEVQDYVVRKAGDPERWLSGMRRLAQEIAAGAPDGADLDGRRPSKNPSKKSA